MEELGGKCMDQTREKGLQVLGHPPETRRKVPFPYYDSDVFFNMAKCYICDKTCQKHDRNIFETFKASLVVLSIASVKLHVKKLPLGPCFQSILPKINRVPLISNINYCIKFQDKR